MTVGAPRVVVFLGPSLSLERARGEMEDAIYLPPARAGDVYRAAVEHEPQLIALVDGLFDSVPAVWHKEILYALSRGIQVWGAASMGALRAAELWPFGMHGVGRIFERYRCGAWDADDEVAVMHGPAEAGFRAGSTAMANIRLALEDATALGVVSEATAAVLVRAGKTQFYADRSWAGLMAIAPTLGVADVDVRRLRTYVTDERPDAKGDDALALLRTVRELCDEGIAAHAATFEFEPTTFWDRLVATEMPVSAAAPPRLQPAFRRHVRVQPNREEWFRGAALLCMLAAEARRRDRCPSADELQQQADRFRRRHGLLSTKQTEEWLSRNDLAEGDLRKILELESALESIVADMAGSIEGWLALELKRRGAYGGAADAVVAKKRSLDAAAVDSLSFEDAGVSFEELLDWYQLRCGSIDGSLEAHATGLGFESARELVAELLLEYGQTYSPA